MRNKRFIALGTLLLGAVLLSPWFFRGARTVSNAMRQGSVDRDKVADNSDRTNGSLTTQVRPSTSTNSNIAKPTLPIGPAPSVNTNAQPTNSLAQRVNDAALRQIAALQEEKARRTPTQQKIDSQLYYAEKMRRGEPIADRITTLRVELDKDEQGRVEVDITAKVTDQLLNSIV